MINTIFTCKYRRLSHPPMSVNALVTTKCKLWCWGSDFWGLANQFFSCIYLSGLCLYCMNACCQSNMAFPTQKHNHRAKEPLGTHLVRQCMSAILWASNIITGFVGLYRRTGSRKSHHYCTNTLSTHNHGTGYKAVTTTKLSFLN